MPADWHDFATMIGGASGALTGLLFVAVSLNANRIAGHTGLRASAAQTLVLFIIPLFIAVVLLTPRQPGWVLGAELMGIGVFGGLVLLSNHRVKRGLADEDRRLISIFNRPAPNVIAMLLVMTSGVILAAGQDDGLYLLVPALIVAFGSGVLNAWFFLLPPPGGRTLSRRRREAPGESPADPPMDEGGS
jgi:modulator of FtsH protease